jgi:hypothetical protein
MTITIVATGDLGGCEYLFCRAALLWMTWHSIKVLRFKLFVPCLLNLTEAARDPPEILCLILRLLLCCYRADFV